jgi:predicted transposase YbfD/YdcC
VHLFAALDRDAGAVLGKFAVDAKTNEINAFAPPLDRLNITSAIITADALRTQRAHATYLTGRGVHYLTSFMTRSQHSRQVVTAARCPPAP